MVMLKVSLTKFQRVCVHEIVYSRKFSKSLKSFNALNIKSVRMGQNLEMAFLIQLKTATRASSLSTP